MRLLGQFKKHKWPVSTLSRLFIIPETLPPVLPASLSKPQFWCHRFHESALHEASGSQCWIRMVVANRRVGRKQASYEIPAPMLNGCVTLENVLNPLGLGLLTGKLEHDLRIYNESENQIYIHKYQISTHPSCLNTSLDYGQLLYKSAFKFLHFYFSLLALFSN